MPFDAPVSVRSLLPLVPPELRPVIRETGPGDGRVALENAVRGVRWVDFSKAVLTTPSGRAAARAALAPLAPTLGRIETASRAAYYSSPPLSLDRPAKSDDLLIGDFRTFASIRAATKTLRVRASLARAEGRIRDAARDLGTMDRIGALLMDGNHFLLQLLVGMSIRNTASAEGRRIAEDVRVSPADRRLVLAALPAWDGQGPISRTLRTESLYPLLFIASFTDKELSKEQRAVFRDHPNPFDRRATVALATARIRRQITEVSGRWQVAPPDEGRPDPALEKVLSWQKIEDVETMRRHFATMENPVGRAILTLLTPMERDADEAYRRARALRGATRRWLGGPLAPDPFGVGPLQERGREVWSVGPNGRDDGGRKPLDLVYGRR